MGKLRNRRAVRAMLAGLTKEGDDDVVGDVGVGDFVPWLGLVSKVAAGVGQKVEESSASKKKGASSPEEAVQRALEKERDRQRQEKMASETNTLKWLLFGILGLLGIGGAALTIRAITRK